MKLLPLLCLGLCACASTTYRKPDGTLFHTNADVASLRIGADGSLTMTGVNHSTPQHAISETVTARANGIGGIIGALGTAMILK